MASRLSDHLILSSVKILTRFLLSGCQERRTGDLIVLALLPPAWDLKYISHDGSLQPCQRAFSTRMTASLAMEKLHKHNFSKGCHDQVNILFFAFGMDIQIYQLTLFLILYKKLLCMSNYFVVRNNLSWPGCLWFCHSPASQHLSQLQYFTQMMENTIKIRREK